MSLFSAEWVTRDKHQGIVSDLILIIPFAWDIWIFHQCRNIKISRYSSTIISSRVSCILYAGFILNLEVASLRLLASVLWHFLYAKVFICLCVWVNTQWSLAADPWATFVASHLPWIKLRPAGFARSSFNCWAIFPAPSNTKISKRLIAAPAKSSLPWNRVFSPSTPNPQVTGR